MDDRQFWLPALLIALGITSAGFFMSQTLYNSRVGINTAEVKGLAERRVKSDRAYWIIGYVVTGQADASTTELYERSTADRNKLVDLLKRSGFDDAEIGLGIVDYQRREYRNEDQALVDTKQILSGSVEIETDQVDLVAEARSRLNELISAGVDIRNNPPAYHFTGLNEIKPQMVKEATTNARAAATEFAENAGVQVGGIRTARQGGFVIRDVGERYGDTAKIDKEVRVVTTIDFYLVD
ncbi:MAG: SIMPL domain-containing protein [Pseudomonadota bacterium]